MSDAGKKTSRDKSRTGAAKSTSRVTKTKTAAEAARTTSEPKAKRASSAKPKTRRTPDPEKFTGPARVYAFADSLEQESESTEAQQAKLLETWVMFGLAGETFAMPVAAVQETLRVSTITRVPHAPFPVSGIMNMRGRVVPVVNLRVRLGLPAVEIDSSSRILITSSHGRLIGLLVDSAQQVVRIDMNAVEAPPPDVMTAQSEYIVGVYRHMETLLILLDVERALSIPDSLQPVEA